jgi:hypothetical protein
MTTTLREFSRNLARHRRAAANGREITVQDGKGATSVFKRMEAPVRTMADHVGHLSGSVCTGKRVKSLAGYGRAKRHFGPRSVSRLSRRQRPVARMILGAL